MRMRSTVRPWISALPSMVRASVAKRLTKHRHGVRWDEDYRGERRKVFGGSEYERLLRSSRCRPPGLQIMSPSPSRGARAAGLVAGEGLPPSANGAQLARAVLLLSQQLRTGLLVFAVVMGASALGVLAGQYLQANSERYREPIGVLQDTGSRRTDPCLRPRLLLTFTKIAARI